MAASLVNVDSVGTLEQSGSRDEQASRLETVSVGPDESCEMILIVCRQQVVKSGPLPA